MSDLKQNFQQKKYIYFAELSIYINNNCLLLIDFVYLPVFELFIKADCAVELNSGFTLKYVYFGPRGVYSY